MKTFIAFPCYKPAREQWLALGEFIREFRRRVSEDTLFCVVNDGSPEFDPPPSELLGLFRLETLPCNLGKGAALRRAAEVMPDDREIFAFLDFDLPYSLEEMAGICGAVKEGVDVCIGIRSGAGASTSSDRISRQISHRLFRLFVRSIVVGSISDTQCGIKAFRADAVKWIARRSKINGFLFDMEWLYIALHHGMCVRQWPVSVGEGHRSGRLSSYRLWRLSFELLSLVANILRRNYQEPGLVSLIRRYRESVVRRSIRP